MHLYLVFIQRQVDRTIILTANQNRLFIPVLHGISHISQFNRF